MISKESVLQCLHSWPQVIALSEYMEKNITPQMREMGSDLADWVVENEPF